MSTLNYSSEESQYIEDNWGTISIKTIAKNLNRSAAGIINKKGRLGLGSFLENGEYITVNQFFKAIGRNGGWTYTIKQMMDKGFPVKKKRVLANSFKVIYLNDFWKWAKEYRMHINFNKFKENVLGEEPSWVKDQRKADIEFARYKVTPWTSGEDSQLESLLKLYKYTYPQLSKAIRRTEGAIKRRCVDLNIKERPLRESPHGIWTSEQVAIVIKMYQMGYRGVVIRDYVNKSEQAVNGKIERLIINNSLSKRK